MGLEQCAWYHKSMLAGGHSDHGDRQQERGDAGQHGQDEERLYRLQHGTLQHRGGRPQSQDPGSNVGESPQPGKSLLSYFML